MFFLLESSLQKTIDNSGILSVLTIAPIVFSLAYFIFNPPVRYKKCKNKYKIYINEITLKIRNIQKKEAELNLLDGRAVDQYRDRRDDITRRLNTRVFKWSYWLPIAVAFIYSATLINHTINYIFSDSDTIKLETINSLEQLLGLSDSTFLLYMFLVLLILSVFVILIVNWRIKRLLFSLEKDINKRLSDREVKISSKVLDDRKSQDFPDNPFG